MSILEKIRKNKKSWSGMACKEARSDDRRKYDENEKARYSLLIELQYDFQESDRELIRFLFEQEVISREKGSSVGIGNSLWLGAFLLAKFKDPGDISLFFRANNSNFDTYCGFDIEFLFWLLGEEMDSYLAKNNSELLNDLGGVYFDSGLGENIEDWWANKLIQYPDCVEKELPLVLYERSLYFGDIEKARIYLDLWALGEPESCRKEISLKRAYENFGEFDKAIQISRKLIDLKDSGWDKAVAYGDLLKLYIQVGAPSDAVEYIERIDAEFRKFDDWQRTGLGRMTVKSVFEYSCATNNSRSGKKAFKYADTWSKQVERLPFAVLEAGVKAAEKWSMYFKARKYRKLAKQERARIDSM
jgi:tetratricopeptide (TPR) repeat protein